MKIMIMKTSINKKNKTGSIQEARTQRYDRIKRSQMMSYTAEE